MRIAYISSAAYSDVDLSFVGEAQRRIDLTYFVLVHHRNKQSCALDFREDELTVGVNKGESLKALQCYSDIIDVKRTFVLYSDGKCPYGLSVFWNNYKLKNFLNSNFDLIHLTTAPALNNPFLYTCKNKLVLTVHDPIPHSSASSKGMELGRKIAFKIIKNLILLNTTQRIDFCRYYKVPEDNIFISSLSCYNYFKKYSGQIAVKKPYILYFGNITSYKGLDVLFLAMKIVHKKHPELKLIVAGKGRYYFDISEYNQLDYFDIRNHFIPNNELAGLIENSEFVVVPYIDATQSGVVMSAYAFNKPCVATNVGGLPEMVEDKKYGLICEPKNVESLANAMIKLYEDSILRDYFTENIKKDFEIGNKSWAGIVIDIIEYYKLLL